MHNMGMGLLFPGIFGAWAMLPAAQSMMACPALMVPAAYMMFRSQSLKLLFR